MGVKTPYSGSKGAAELVIKSFFESYFNTIDCNVRLGIGRAGNVIGGGDWAPYRIVPDCVRSWSKGEKPKIRSPHSTRPWQHVLEPLSGYLRLASVLSKSKEVNGEAFNFGPSSDTSFSVKDLVEEIILNWPGIGWIDESEFNKFPHEAGLLKLNCDKAANIIQWRSTLNFSETSKWTAEWYYNYYKSGPKKALETTYLQIEKFMELSKKRKLFDL